MSVVPAIERAKAAAPGAAARIAAAWEILATVEDPEIPALSIVDLGLIRFVRAAPNGQIEVGLSPTYVGCQIGRASCRERV